ncbi:MAG: hypothetical protein EBV83_06260 [Verrucomicrobia bacterium]|nr:hypothetical protein [Verrucomicrobiota bacterium]
MPILTQNTVQDYILLKISENINMYRILQLLIKKFRKDTYNKNFYAGRKVIIHIITKSIIF